MNVHQTARAGNQPVHSQAAIALALLSAWQDRSNQLGPTLEDVSRRLLKLLGEDIQIEDLGLRNIPGGVYSEDVETFVGHLLAEGLATQRSPLRLTAEGDKLLRSIIRVEYKDLGAPVKRAAEVLHLDASELLAGIG